jgi:hypothetical protein
MEPVHDLSTSRRPLLSVQNRRIAAAALELVPIIPFAMQFSSLTPRDEVTPLWVLAFTTGLGWAIAGRWRTGLMIAAVRVAVLWAGIYALLITSFGGDCALGDDTCDDGLRMLATPMLWAMGLFYVGSAIASAWLAQRAAAKSD